MFADVGHTYRTALSNGVLIQEVDPGTGDAHLTLTLTKPQLLGLLGGQGLDGVATAGDTSRLQALLGLLDQRIPVLDRHAMTGRV